ncbi:MAG: MFS transporter [Saprospiraceae bacterium]|jgi:maltose/moltooligosaccharide transporter
MKTKPVLSFWDIWNMSFGFLGIQFGFALQNANVSRIFETLGGATDKLAMYWLAAPVTGLVVQPIVGYFSDRTWHPRWGRRRPYFAIGAILATVTLFLMPNSPSLFFAVGMLWIMDSSINISMEPFRAFVGDNLPSEQRAMGFAMQSFFIGVGAVVASALPWVFTNWMGIPNTAAEGAIPPSVKWSFYIGAIIFLSAVMWTVLRSREYDPETLASFEEKSAATELENSVQGLGDPVVQGKRQLVLGGAALLVGLLLSALLNKVQASGEVYILGAGLALFGLLMMLSGALLRAGSANNGFVTIMSDLQTMPGTMRQLAVVQFFSWFGLFAMWIYTTSAVTSRIFGSSDPTSEAYNNGADWVTVCFSVYNGVSALVAFLLPVIARYSSRKFAHALSLILGAAGLASFYVIKDPQLLLLSMVGVGFAWSSILSMPYAILTGTLPAQKMGYYMGVFNFFIVIPQIVAASLLGFLLKKYFDGEAVYALLTGGASFVVAAICTFLVDDRDDPNLAG